MGPLFLAFAAFANGAAPELRCPDIMQRQFVYVDRRAAAKIATILERIGQGATPAQALATLIPDPVLARAISVLIEMLAVSAQENAAQLRINVGPHGTTIALYFVRALPWHAFSPLAMNAALRKVNLDGPSEQTLCNLIRYDFLHWGLFGSSRAPDPAPDMYVVGGRVRIPGTNTPQQVFAGALKAGLGSKPKALVLITYTPTDRKLPTFQ